MITSTPALLALSLKQLAKPFLAWWLKQRLTQSERNVEVIRRERLQNYADEQAEHRKQVHLVSRLTEIERS